jgi:hypothetical protein
MSPLAIEGYAKSTALRAGCLQLGNAAAIAAIARPHHGPDADRIGLRAIERPAPSGGQPFPDAWGCLQ